MAYKSQQAEIVERLIRIEERSTQAATHITELHEKLFGNGQPGLIAQLSARIAVLEQTRFWIWGLTIGGGTVLIFAVKVLVFGFK